MRGSNGIYGSIRKEKLMKQLLKLKRSRILLLLPITVIILIIVKNSEFIAEYVFARGIYKLISMPIGLITGIFPFSLAEMIIILTPLIVIVIVALFIRSLIKERENRRFVVQKGILNLFCFISIAAFLFVLLCGTNYYRYKFESYCDFETREYTVDELYALCMQLKDKVEKSKQEIPDCYKDENGVVVFEKKFSDTAKEAEKAMSSLADIYPVLKYSTGGAKKVMLSRYMSYGGIVGIFIPFTVEANVNTDVPDYNRPADTCHELAHMRGFMKEEEANYIAYLACVNYDNPIFKYSGYMLAFIHSTNALYDYDAEAYWEIMDNLSDEVRAEIVYENKYWAKLRESEAAQVADTVMTTVNDTYLKVNGQENGVNSYGDMVDLLLAEFLSDK